MLGLDSSIVASNSDPRTHRSPSCAPYPNSRLNFPSKWDEAWLPMLSMKATGEEKFREVSLPYTNYRKGDFIHCSLSLYRQLRRGNPGAVKLFANLLAR